jgi:hypothetical protein
MRFEFFLKKLRSQFVITTKKKIQPLASHFFFSKFFLKNQYAINLFSYDCLH